MSTIKGQVKTWNDSKGFGFITAEVNGQTVEIFAHYTAIQGDGFQTLYEGQRVEFEVFNGPKGPQAANIVKE